MQIKQEKIKIDTLIISDIHLGDKTTRCQEALDVLDKYEYKKLILNGDILNGLSFKRLHTGHWRILSALRKLSKGCEVIWVHGNHDAASDILSRLLGIKVCNKYIWKSGDKKFLAIHGHQYDKFMHNNLIIRYAAYMLYNFIKSLDNSGFLIGLIRKYNGTWQRDSEEVAKGALGFGKSLRADYVFCGHTHVVNETAKYGIKYLNSGSWVESPSGYVTVSGDKVELCQIE